MFERYFVLHYCCGGLALLHQLAEWVYLGKAMQRFTFGLLMAILSISLLGGFWLKVCWNASPALGWPTMWRRCGASPLRRWAWAGLRDDLYLRGPRPLAWLAACGRFTSATAAGS